MYGPIVYRLGRWPLTPERGVRFPLGLLSSSSNNKQKFNSFPGIVIVPHFENGAKITCQKRVRNNKGSFRKIWPLVTTKMEKKLDLEKNGIGMENLPFNRSDFASRFPPPC